MFKKFSRYLCVAFLLSTTYAIAESDDENVLILPDILTLEQAKTIALENNPSLAAAEASIAEAEARVRQAWAAYLPSLDLNVGASETRMSDNNYNTARTGALSGSLTGFTSQFQSSLLSGNPLPATTLIQNGLISGATGLYARSQVDSTIENYSADISLTWLLFDGFRREFATTSARIGAENSKSSFDESKRFILSAVAGSYFNAQLARERITIAEADSTFNEQQLKDAKARSNAGTGSLSDELNFEIRVNVAKDTLTKADMQYKIAMIGLAGLLGLPDADFPNTIELEKLLPEGDRELELPDENIMIELALENRPDLQQAQQFAELAEANVGIQKSVFYPMVSAIAARSATGNRSLHFGENDFATTIGINISMNLFSGGRDKARLKEAKAARVGAMRMTSQAEIQVISEVRQAIATLESSRESLYLQRKNADNVKQNRELVEKEYKAGQTSLVRLNQAQFDLVQAEANLALARVALRLAWDDLETATAKNISRESESQ